MKPHPRLPNIRKTVKWGGAAVTVLLVVVWIGSGWWFVSLSNSTGGCLALEHGRLNVVIPNADSNLSTNPGLYASRCQFRMWWSFEASHPGYAFYCVPLWGIAGIVACATWVVWWFDALALRRDRIAANQCPKCEYDRTDLAAGAICPECGAASP